MKFKKWKTDKIEYHTGWFGIPEGPESKNTKVHVIMFLDGKEIPICMANIGKKQAFQFCSAGINLKHVECQNCLRIIKS